MNGTPIIDIKPYIRFSDSHPDAVSGYVDEVPWQVLAVDFSEEALAHLESCSFQSKLTRELVTKVVGLDPRPGYQREMDKKKYDVQLCGQHVRFTIDGGRAHVFAITTD
jgi:hypothetical protein